MEIVERIRAGNGKQLANRIGVALAIAWERSITVTVNVKMFTID